MRIPVFDFQEILRGIKKIIPTAPIQIDRQFYLTDHISELVPLFKTEHR
jgi:hypothetical protein